MSRTLTGKRAMAHAIEFEGRRFPLSIATISENRRSVVIAPFERETAATPFVNGTVAVERDSGGLLFFVKR